MTNSHSDESFTKKGFDLFTNTLLLIIATIIPTVMLGVASDIKESNQRSIRVELGLGNLGERVDSAKKDIVDTRCTLGEVSKRVDDIDKRVLIIEKR